MSGTTITDDTIRIAKDAGRMCGTPGHRDALEYLRGRLSEIGLAPFAGASCELGYQCDGMSFANLVGVVPGKDRAKKPILVGAHYDSVIAAQCADDNATAVAVCLAIAEDLMQTQPERDVVIALFDAEEPPYFMGDSMGSNRFYEDHCEDVEFQCAIVLDLIGHDVELGDGMSESAPHLKDLLFVLGAESGPAALTQAVTQAGDDEGPCVLAALNDYVGGDMSDHHAFRIGVQPYLFLTCAQGEHYHGHGDTVDWVNFDKVRRVHEYVLSLVRALDVAEDTQPVGSPDGDPAATLEYEIASVRRAFGPVLPLVLGALGLLQLETREDMDRLAGALTGMIG